MKKLILLCAFFILLHPLIIQSQDSLQQNLYPIKSSGSRLTLDINSNYFKSSGNEEIYRNEEQININSALKGLIWRYGEKINYLGYCSVNEYYSYYERTDRIDKQHSVYGNFYVSADYYLKPNKLYINGSYELYLRSDYRYNKLKIENEFYKNEYDYACATHNLWFSAGWGRLINHARNDKLGNIENVLLKNKTVKDPLSISVKNKLLRLIEKRNNLDYQSKYKDDDEIRFMRDIENLLLQEKVINTPLGAEAVMKIYQVITNKKFVYYPEFRGLQSQIEIQFNPIDTGSIHDFVILSSHYGFGISDKTNTLISGFFSIPLRKRANDYYMFGNIARNPFTNILPVIAERYGLDIYKPEFYSDSRGYLYLTSLDYIAGLKFDIFHSFSNTIGMYGWGKGVAVKPSDVGFRNILTFGLQIDFNLLSFIYFSGGINWFRRNDGYSQISSAIGTSLIIF